MNAATSRADKARANRRRMRAAALVLFTDRGYASTSMQAIAAEAGMAVQTLYFTFGTKSALLVARGNFDFTLLENLAVQHGGVVEKYREKQLVSKANESGDGRGGTLACSDHQAVCTTTAKGDTHGIWL